MPECWNLNNAGHYLVQTQFLKARKPRNKTTIKTTVPKGYIIPGGGFKENKQITHNVKYF